MSLLSPTRRAGFVRTLVLALMTCPAAGVLSHVHAQEMDVPVAMQLPLFLKVMSFDRQLATRTGDTMVVAVLYQSGNRESARAKNDAVRALGAGSGESLALRVVPIDLDAEPLARIFADRKICVLYVAPLRAVDLAAVAALARAAHVTTVTGVPEYLDQGLAVSVRSQGGRPRILVNLTAARAEGASFSAELLKLAEVTR